MHNWPPKDPDEVLDYQFDWTDRLVTDETITNSEFILIEGSITLGSQDEADGVTTVWISGGDTGEICMVNNHIITSDGREYDETVRLRIKDR